MTIENLDYQPDKKTEEGTDEETILQEGPVNGFTVTKKGEIGEPDGSEDPISGLGRQGPWHHKVVNR